MRYRKICPVCGKAFTTDIGNKKYCGHKCYSATKHRRPEVVERRQEQECGFEVVRTRRCHDCGKPTTNYRCEECWTRLRKRVNW